MNAYDFGTLTGHPPPISPRPAMSPAGAETNLNQPIATEGAASMLDFHRSPAVWFVVLVIATMALAKRGGYIGR